MADCDAPTGVSPDVVRIVDVLSEKKRRVAALAYVAVDGDGNVVFARSVMSKAQYKAMREMLLKMFDATTNGQLMK